MDLSSDELREIIALSRMRPRLSPYDCAVIVVARREGAPLVTSNFGHIPTEAENHGVVTHGVLYVAERLVSLAVIDPSAATSALERMLDGGSFLPVADCQKLIERWGTRLP